MKKSDLLNTICRRTVAVSCALAIGAPALAQESLAADERGDGSVTAAPAQNDAQAGGNDAPIVITGSRIVRPNLTSTVPVTTVDPEEFLATGNISLGDAINQLPALRPTFSQASSQRSISTTGLNLLDLRGLGVARTLVLVNGRRHVTAQAGGFNVDVNTIPSDLIQRVDIVTGGNSAVYGSDAVAGVVNFILRRDFEGLRVRAQGGISDQGDRGNYLVSMTAGRNFADGRGNIAVNVEYARLNELGLEDRDELTGAFSGRSIFAANELVGGNSNPGIGPTVGAEAAAGNGFPDTIFLRNILNQNVSDGSLYTATCPTARATNASGAFTETEAEFQARRAASCSSILNPAVTNPLGNFGRVFVFRPDGTLIENPCIRDLRVFNSQTCVGGLGTSLRRGILLEPGQERVTANLLASFEVSPAFRPFIEAKYVRIESTQAGQPTFQFSNFSVNNPFLTPQARATLQPTLAPGQTTFSTGRFNSDFGSFGGTAERQTWRVVAGVDGTFNDDWRYEVALSYGRLDTDIAADNNLLIPQYNRAINAVRNAQGQIVCAVNADANPANDDPACAPADLFGENRLSQAARDYILHTSTRIERATQVNAVAFVSGDLSQWFELPGGPVAFAFGVEYRRETAFAQSDAITSSGVTQFSLGPIFDPPTYEVKEAFGEIRIPILEDRPFFEELSIEAAGRVSSYNLGSTGTVFAYNVGASWAPSPDIRFRGGYARSVRAPNLSNLFATPTQSPAPLGLPDPCGQQNINNNPNRVRNCAAAGVPTTQTFTLNGITTTEPFTNRATASLQGVQAGNPDLEEERSRSITVGFVAQPRFLPGFSLSLDYYDVTIRNAITALTPQNIIEFCYDDPNGIDNQYCDAVFRNPNGTFAGQTTVGHAGGVVALTTTGPSFVQQPFNFQRTENVGIDADANYRLRLGSGVTLDLRTIASYVIKRNNFTSITDPTFANRQKSELGDPAWRAIFSARIDFGAVDISYRGRYIGRQTIATEYEAQNSFQGRPPTNADAFPRIWFPDVLYHDVRVGFEINERFSFYAGVDNLLDRMPPFNIITGDPATVTGGSPWDNIGRYFYAGVITNF